MRKSSMNNQSENNLNKNDIMTYDNGINPPIQSELITQFLENQTEEIKQRSD